MYSLTLMSHCQAFVVFFFLEQDEEKMTGKTGGQREGRLILREKVIA